jgi:predicted dehydrogenase
MTYTEPVRWGIIGCGNVTEVKSGPALQNAQGSALVAVMRRDADLARDYAERHGVLRWYSDADRLIADPEVDAIYVATPVSTHMDYAVRAAQAGKPVYVEKPMARSHGECQAMIRACRDAEVPLFVAYYRRGLPRFLKTREMIGAGEIGVPTSVTLRFSAPRHLNLDARNLPWRLTAEHGGGGLVMDLASHALDIVDFILGPLEEVHGDAVNRASSYAVEDIMTLHFRAGGVPGVGIWSFATTVQEDVLEFSGTKGRISLSVFGSEPVVVGQQEDRREIDLPNPTHIQQPLIQTIVDELLGRGQSPSTGVTAARTNAVLDTALAAYYGGREDAFWERPESWPGARGS